ncbi:MAG: hypothetical protein ABI321_12965 [Polyangia bacterium]
MRRALAVLLMLLTISAFAGKHPADETLARLARAFDAKDRAAVEREIVDPWSGTRFITSWDEAGWKDAARALRGAKLESSATDTRIYIVKIHARQRKVSVLRRDDRWLLDYNSFLGPFPTF